MTGKERMQFFTMIQKAMHRHGLSLRIIIMVLFILRRTSTLLLQLCQWNPASRSSDELLCRQSLPDASSDQELELASIGQSQSAVDEIQSRLRRQRRKEKPISKTPTIAMS